MWSHSPFWAVSELLILNLLSHYVMSHLFELIGETLLLIDSCDFFLLFDDSSCDHTRLFELVGEPLILLSHHVITLAFLSWSVSRSFCWVIMWSLSPFWAGQWAAHFGESSCDLSHLFELVSEPLILVSHHVISLTFLSWSVSRSFCWVIMWSLSPFWAGRWAAHFAESSCDLSHLFELVREPLILLSQLLDELCLSSVRHPRVCTLLLNLLAQCADVILKLFNDVLVLPLNGLYAKTKLILLLSKFLNREKQLNNVSIFWFLVVLHVIFFIYM